MPPRPKKKIDIKENSLLSALKFCQLVLSDKGAPVETHVQLNNKTAVAFNGILSAGALIEEDIYACPNNKLLIEAMSKCGQTYSFVQLDQNRLQIKSDKFKAIVPCIDPSTIPTTQPDNFVCEITDVIKTAINAVSVLTSDEGQTIHTTSILVRPNSTVATNGYIIFEYWHGFNLPTVAVPKALASALANIDKKVSGLGFSDNSVSFFFEDNSWIKSQLFRDEWPKVDHLLNVQANLWPVPGTFFEGVAAVTPFSSDGLLYFDKDLIKSHATDGVGATYEVTNLPKGPIFNAKNLMLVKPHAKVIDFVAPGLSEGQTMLVFQGDNIRGAMLGRM